MKKELFVIACILVGTIAMFSMCDRGEEPGPAVYTADTLEPVELVFDVCDGYPEVDKFRFLFVSVDSCEALRAMISPLCPEKVKDYKILCIVVGEREQCWTNEFFLKQMGCE